MLYLTDPGIWAGVAALVATVWILIKLGQHDQELLDREERALLREQIAADNAVLDAAWRTQLDREQLFRDYIASDKVVGL